MARDGYPREAHRRHPVQISLKDLRQRRQRRRFRQKLRTPPFVESAVAVAE